MHLYTIGHYSQHKPISTSERIHFFFEEQLRFFFFKTNIKSFFISNGAQKDFKPSTFFMFATKQIIVMDIYLKD